MKRFSDLTQILVFLLFLALGLVLLIALPRRTFSEQENRVLAQPPRFRVSDLASGAFTQGVEDCITDQFPLRDSWISLKSRTERALGKTENNNVFFCREDTLITRFPQPEESTVVSAVRAVNALAEGTKARVFLALIPSSAAVWSDRLPAHANTADQEALIRRIYGEAACPAADVLSALTEHRDEEIYYRTDHHWTTLGAYYGYAASARAMGLTPAPKESFQPATVTEAFYGTVYSSSGVRWVKPDSISRWVEPEGVTVYRDDGEEPSPVYAEEKLAVKDKYAYFFGGNTPRMVIETGQTGGRLLVLRDSYSDCELPFFFSHYSEIHVLDLRYFRRSVREYAEDNAIDDILINYSLSTFLSDPSVFLLGT
jgi:hypothetical protein